MDTTFKFRALSAPEIEKVYNTYMVNDFHSNELKPLALMLEFKDKGFYNCYGLFDNDELLAYGLLFFNNECALLDYYAVLEEKRNSGIGSKFIAFFKEMVNNNVIKSLIAEVENPEYAVDDNDLANRKRRINFYSKNNLKMTDIKVLLFGSNYNIWHYDNTISNDIIYKELDGIYYKMFNEKLYKENVFVTRG